ncbi:hypothetical protein L2164_13345 [Pectobacterium brasiliense]|uniref:hypothetical protein n=1 Tax=Pectobacterium TaxID=122277 RepID=UPI000AF8405F|nr:MULTISPECIES: hypothetical protein [Pectobacterium]MCG5049681.1 hypothetical protein [Pectobacterium brasiliense]
MKILADQAENNVSRVVNEANLSGAVSEGTFADLRTAENGEESGREADICMIFFSCGYF